MERKITFKGKPLTLEGVPVTVKDKAPDFTVVNQDLQDVTLSAFKDRIKIITTFPSLDTPVCDLQVKEFNKRASALSSEVAVIGISKDLPFAQKRFCEYNTIKNVTILSDYKYSSFGQRYGLLIKELNLLARSVMVIDKESIIQYLQIVPELAHPPDYEDALRSLSKVLTAIS